MRVELRRRDGQRIVVTATIADYSARPWRKTLIPTTLLANLAHHGEPLCDHLWIEGRFTEKWKHKKIRFTAKVIPYRRRDYSLDYKLINVSDVKVIGDGEIHGII